MLKLPIMKIHGVLAADFSKRIGENGQIAEAWPFSSLVPTEDYQTDIGCGLTARDGIAVGRVLFANARGATLRVHSEYGHRGLNGDRVSLLFDNPDEALPWKQLVGIALAMEVSVVGSASSHHTTYKPEQILAVEPPVTHPDYLRTKKLGSELGYLQGVVGGASDSYKLSSRDTMQLEIPGIDRPLTINCHSEPRLFTPEGIQCEALYRGDVVRAEVARPGMELATYMAGSVIYTIGHIL